jgi:hypothetical protein
LEDRGPDELDLARLPRVHDGEPDLRASGEVTAEQATVLGRHVRERDAVDGEDHVADGEPARSAGERGTTRVTDHDLSATSKPRPSTA